MRQAVFEARHGPDWDRFEQIADNSRVRVPAAIVLIPIGHAPSSSA